SAPSPDAITAGPVPCANCGATVDSRASSCWNCGLVFGYAGSAERELWVPLRTPADHGPRAYAAQLLEMLRDYRLIANAWLDPDSDGFVVIDGGQRTLTADQVLDEYGARVADMVTAVMERSSLTTTDVPVKVDAAGGPVPFVEDVEDRLTEYLTYWPERNA
ncbi:hypothetical protein, partial [Nocardiopsis exhalans]